MDELSAFRFADPQLPLLERALMARADVLFTGGASLFEAKRHLHRNVHAFPSGVDVARFRTARAAPILPEHAANPGCIRLGYFGVIDERIDLGLLAALADARPSWVIEMIGPVVKIDPADLPRRPNIVYRGGKSYDSLPAYVASWDAALMPFALNEATRLISPTKRPSISLQGARSCPRR